MRMKQITDLETGKTVTIPMTLEENLEIDKAIALDAVNEHFDQASQMAE